MFGWVLNASVFLTVDEIYESQEAHSEPSQLSLMELLREWLTAFSRETFLQKVLYQIFYRVLPWRLSILVSKTTQIIIWYGKLQEKTQYLTRENTRQHMNCDKNSVVCGCWSWCILLFRWSLYFPMNNTSRKEIGGQIILHECVHFQTFVSLTL